MLVFVARPDAPVEFSHCSPSLPFSLRRVNAVTSFNFASCRSRNLGTVFRSPVTALSPPLRGPCSRPAPSIPRYKLSRVRSTFDSSAPFGFEADTGRNRRQKPVSRANLRRSCSFPGIHSPSGVLTDPPDQSVRPVPPQETRLPKRPMSLTEAQDSLHSVRLIVP